MAAAFPTNSWPGCGQFEPPPDPPLKPPSEWALLGKSLPRVDMEAKCTGTAVYGIDVSLPGLLFATVRRNPQLGGLLLDFDDSRASSMPGVMRIIPIETGVIVVASNTWYAMQAAAAIDCNWGSAPYPPSSADHRQQLADAFEDVHYYRARNRGNVDAALGARVDLAGEYRVPYLAHATMEPLNATARLLDGRLDIWAGNQFPTLAVLVGARLAGLPKAAVSVHTTYMGGGFGRRFEMDDVAAAVLAARAMPGRPVRSAIPGKRILPTTATAPWQRPGFAPRCQSGDLPPLNSACRRRPCSYPAT